MSVRDLRTGGYDGAEEGAGEGKTMKRACAMVNRYSQITGKDNGVLRLRTS